MRRLFSVAAVVAVVGCHGSHSDTSPTGASAQRSELLSHVPADTPYLFATTEPPPRIVLEKLYGPLANQFATAMHDGDLSRDGASAAEIAPIADALKGVAPDHYWEALGFAPGGRFVVYGLSVWPVVRIEVADPVKLSGIAQKVIAVDGKAQTHDLAGKKYWTFSKHDMTAVLAILDRELVISLLPDAEVANALPSLLGAELPKQSLADAPTVPTLLSSHKFLPTMYGYIDSQRVVDVITGKGAGPYDKLVGEKVMSATAACHDDFALFASIVPRVTLGYTQLDGNGISGQIAFETTPAAAASLMALHADGPALPSVEHSLGAMSADIDVDAAVKWVTTTIALAHLHHFSCGATADLNAELDEAVKNPIVLPSYLNGLRGGQLVLEDANISPPSGKGTMTVLGAHVADAVQALLAKVAMFSPDLAHLHLVADGSPISLPVAELNIPYFSSAHVALKADRLVAAVGDDSAKRAMAALAAPSVHAPLFAIAYNMTLVRQRFGMLFKTDKSTQADAFSTLAFAVDANQTGVVIDMTGQWAK